ncbi:probable helicase CHR10 [Impatiens glandulifera]|uniref:probable helicase CHR10 n=1 Tax=Impatiens glandulifera TaxID=253017 RepID=UPI001FB0FA48|nr:probable helicase CHR10 [Impatiens glandulifera]
MDYETRLAAAAKLVYAADSSNVEETPVDPAEIGVTAILKPHQLEGLSWLIRRYKIGVNVILGDEVWIHYMQLSKLIPI